MRFALSGIIAAVGTAAALAATSTPPAASSTGLVQAAEAFLATLGPDERAAAEMAFESEKRYDWHFTAKPREGLPWKRMTDAQRQAALDLLRAALSERGLEKAETIRRLEDVLYELENRSPRRDRERYHFTVFGKPSPGGVWGWRYEGHHLSFNFTVKDGTVVASTPQFLGANPAEVKDGPMKGTRVLAREEDLARDLLGSLGDEQKAKAIVGTEAPPEILTGASRKAAAQEDAGIAYAGLNERQKAQLVALIEEHAVAQKADLARERLDEIRKAGLDKVKFAWMGSLEKGKGHYYRVQGPTFLIEYDNTQTGANHAHAVWRDFDGDWGADLLAEHLLTKH